MPKKRAIGIETVNDIRAAGGGFVTGEDLDEAEFLLRCALARMGIPVRGRRLDVAIGGSE